jgi:hypothetical protein
MGVYVDNPKHAYGRMTMCHMLADTAEELHAMADLIGIARRWYQTDASFPHYDISKGKRTLAVQAGAIEVDRRGLYAVMSRVRKQILEDPVFAATWRAETN